VYVRGVPRLAVLAALYFAQGLPFGFFSHAVPTLLNRTHPAHIVGLSSLLAIPWALKFAWAPWIDRLSRGGPRGRRRVLVPLQLTTSAALAALGLWPPGGNQLVALSVGFFLVSALSATQDIATDALSVDWLAPEERGLGGSVQAGAYRAGMIAGGGGVMAFVDRIGLGEAFVGMAALVAASTVPLVLVALPVASARDDANATTTSTGALATILGFFRAPGAIANVGALAAFKLGDALAAGMVTRLYVAHGLSNAEIAYTRGVSGGVASVVGALAAGGLAKRVGLARTVVAAAALQWVAVAMYLVVAIAGPGSLGASPVRAFHALSTIEHVTGGAATAALFACMLGRCRDEARGTDFTLQASVLVGVSGLGVVTSGFVTSAIGLAGLFAVATIVGLASPIAARRLAPAKV
jgi:hypothetical protein